MSGDPYGDLKLGLFKTKNDIVHICDAYEITSTAYIWVNAFSLCMFISNADFLYKEKYYKIIT